MPVMCGVVVSNVRLVSYDWLSAGTICVPLLKGGSFGSRECDHSQGVCWGSRAAVTSSVVRRFWERGGFGGHRGDDGLFWEHRERVLGKSALAAMHDPGSSACMRLTSTATLDEAIAAVRGA